MANARISESDNTPTTVVHVNRKPAYDVYIGRQMPRYPDLKSTGWGNPYKDGLDTPAGRQSAIDRYREWVLTQPKLLARLPELRGKRIACWCAPLGGLPGDLHGRVCHGEVLAALADGWCAQCHTMTSAEHVREHEAAALRAMMLPSLLPSTTSARPRQSGRKTDSQLA